MDYPIPEPSAEVIEAAREYADYNAYVPDTTKFKIVYDAFLAGWRYTSGDDAIAATALAKIRYVMHSESACLDVNAQAVCRAAMHDLIRTVFDHDEPRA